MKTSRVSRRNVVRAGLAVTALSGFAGAACTTEPGSPSSEPNSAQAALPEFTPLTAVEPDLPGDSSGVDPAFFQYPADPEPVTTQSPGDGSEVTFMTQGGTPPPPPEDNSYWAGLNERLNVQVKMNMSPADQYAAKLSTTIAGGDIPDVVQFPVLQPQMGSLLQSEFADLSELLSGENVNEYPGLANLPSRCWQEVRFGGRIYGVPRPLAAAGQVTFTRADHLEKDGLSAEATTFDEFRALCGELTNPRSNSWASSQPIGIVEYVVEMLGGSIFWQQTHQGFIHGFETEEYAQALAAVVDLIDDGVFHPDWGSSTLTHAARFYRAGTVKLLRENFPVWTNLTRAADRAEPGERFTVGALTPHGFDSGTTFRKNLGNPTFGFAAIKKAPPERLEMILRLLNWIASPFGSAEQQYVAYGEEGVDHVRENGEPVLTELGATQVKLVLGYVAKAPAVLYVPGHADVAQAQHEYQQTVAGDAVSDAAAGLESEALITKKAELGTLMINLQNDVLAKRKKVTEWPDLVQEWRQRGGDEIRNELEAAAS